MFGLNRTEALMYELIVSLPGLIIGGTLIAIYFKYWYKTSLTLVLIISLFWDIISFLACVVCAAMFTWRMWVHMVMPFVVMFVLALLVGRIMHAFMMTRIIVKRG